MQQMIDHLSAADLLIGGFVLVVVVGALGGIANLVLRDNGFGMAINGLLLLLGAAAGIVARSATLGVQ